MTRYKSYSTYKPSSVEWLGDIPNHWVLRRIKSVIVNSINGAWGEDPKDDDNDVICVRVADFDYSRLGISPDSLTLRNIDPSQQLSRILLKNDLLIEKSGGGENQSVGRMVSFNLDEKSVCSNFIARLVISQEVHHRFLCYVFAAMYSINLNIRSIKQTTGIQNLDLYSYLCEIFAFPSFQEQDLIANFLDRETTRIDTLITKKYELINLLKKKRAAIITNAVTKGLEPELPMKDSGVEWLGKVPRNWEVKKLKYIAQILRGKFTHRPRNDPRFYDGNYPFIQTGDISAANKYITSYQQTLNELGLSVSKEFPKGTLVMTIAANIGDLAILGFPACFPDSIVGFVPRNYCLDFLYYNLTAMKSEMVKTATLNTQMNLNIDRIGGLFSICPPIAIQKQIATYLDKVNIRIDELIDKTNISISELRKYRQALITAAVTGKIDVREEVERGAA